MKYDLIEVIDQALLDGLDQLLPEGELQGDPVEVIWTVMDSDYWEGHYRYEGIPHIYGGLSPDDPILTKAGRDLSGRMIVRDQGSDLVFAEVYLGHWTGPLVGLHEAAHLLDDSVTQGSSEDERHGPRWFGQYATLVAIWAESVLAGAEPPALA